MDEVTVLPYREHYFIAFSDGSWMCELCEMRLASTNDIQAVGPCQPKDSLMESFASDPPLTSPKQLPDVRQTLLDRWRKNGQYAERAKFQNRKEWTRPDGSIGRTEQFTPAFDSNALAAAELWWVTADMSALIAKAAETLPPTTLNRALVPDPFGVAYFETPLPGHSVDSGSPMPVSIIVWGVTFYNTRTGGTLIEASRAVNPMDLIPKDYVEPSITMSSYGRYKGGPFVPFGRSDWTFGTDTEEMNPAYVRTDLMARSMSEERRWLSCLWILASQKLTDNNKVSADRHTARRMQRAETPAGKGLSSDVRLVDVRRPKATPGEDHEGKKVNWSHRWIVGGESGFWRQQACGPGWSEHRPVYIAPFIKGPGDKPLKVPDRVKVVRGDRGQN